MKRLLSCFICITVLLLFTTFPTVADDSFDEEVQPILNVLVPSNIDFIIDPYEIAGRGQVYSEEFSIINYGETDVLITFTDMEVIFANDTDFELLSEPFSGTGFYGNKAVFLTLDFGRDDIPPFVITDTEITSPAAIQLHVGQVDTECTLSISGSVNPYPTKDWEDGDIKFRLIYQIDPLISNELEEELIELEDIFDGEEVLDANNEDPLLPEAEIEEEEQNITDDEAETEEEQNTSDDESETEEEEQNATDDEAETEDEEGEIEEENDTDDEGETEDE